MDGGDPLLGRTLDDRVRIEARIGRGGMGDVYRARHLFLDQAVAIKVLAEHRASEPDATRRFVREAKSSFLLDHPHCVRVTDLCATSDGLLYLVMEYLDGRTVGEELDVDGAMAAARALHVARQVAEALGHAHHKGLAHRDLKPDNIMLIARDGDPDFAKVLDFGLAKAFDDNIARAAAVSISPLTRDGLVFGTPDYMSPEQAIGGDAGPAADLYALGAVLYHMLTGAPPFVGASPMEVLTHHVRTTAEAPSKKRPDLALPAALDRLVLDLLAKRPADRPASAADAAARMAELRDQVAVGGGRLSPLLASSDTIELSSSEVAGRLPAVAAAADTAAAAAAALPIAVSAAPSPRPAAPATALMSASTELPARRSRGPAIAIAIALLAVAGAAALSFGLGGRAGDPAAKPTAAGAVSPTASVGDASAVASARDGGPAAAAASTDGASDAGTAGAATAAGRRADAGPSPAHHEADPAAARRRAEAARHVHAAEAASRAGNLLRQLAEADHALELDPANRRARELVGLALIKSGDKTRGCAYLRRLRRTYREAGCTD